MTFPSRRPEARRAEYERNIETTRMRYERQKTTVGYARKILAQEARVPASEVPDELAQAKCLHLQIVRDVRSRERDELPPVLAKEYLEGKTTYQLAKEYGIDRGRVAAILTERGIKLKHRLVCKHGHSMTPENTAISSEGWRRCRKCQRARTKASAERKKLHERP